MMLRGHVNGKYAIMSDSSKTAWGTITAPFQLKRRLGECLYLVHLVRDPRAVCWSAIRLSKLRGWKWSRMKQLLSTPTVRCVRTSLGWWVANLSCELFGWFYPRQYLRVQYEDLARCPDAALRTLFDLVSPGVAPQLTEMGVSDNRHQVYGNRVRRQWLLLSDVRLDESWKSEMALFYRYLAAALSWPLRIKYGY